jgi:two-component system LytT family response regulator
MGGLILSKIISCPRVIPIPIASALDYLLKPIDRDELQASVRKITKRNHYSLTQQLELLLKKMHAPAAQITKVAMPTMEGLQMVIRL